jgi:very-short-patch-repair endonuclease
MKVKRNHPVRTITGQWRFIDIWLPEVKLAVEVDDPSHWNREHEDALRTKQIKATMKCKVLRFRNFMILKNINYVVGEIRKKAGLVTKEERAIIYRFKEEFKPMNEHLRMVALYG